MIPILASGLLRITWLRHPQNIGRELINRFLSVLHRGRSDFSQSFRRLAAIEANRDDGPWVRPDHYGKLNGVLRYSRGDSQNGFSLTGMGYWAHWDSTDQVANRARG